MFHQLETLFLFSRSKRSGSVFHQTRARSPGFKHDHLAFDMASLMKIFVNTADNVGVIEIRPLNRFRYAGPLSTSIVHICLSPAGEEGFFDCGCPPGALVYRGDRTIVIIPYINTYQRINSVFLLIYWGFPSNITATGEWWLYNKFFFWVGTFQSY